MTDSTLASLTRGRHRSASRGRPVAAPARRPDLVAPRGHLPGLRPQLRRRRWRRDRRPRRRPRPAAVPPRPRHRRDLVHALVRLADGRRRLRRRRLPGDRPDLRHAGRRRGAHPRKRSTWASGRSSTSSRTTSPTSIPGSRRPSPPAPGRRSASGSGSGPAAARTASEPRPAGSPSSRACPGAGRRTRTELPATGTSTSSPPSSPTSTGTTPTSGQSTSRSCGSGSTAAPPASGSTRRRCSSRIRRCPRSPRDPQPGAHPTHDRDDLHDIYRGWRAVADAYPGDRVLVGEVWLADAERFARFLRPDELHTAFNFDFMARPWDAASLRESIDMTLAAHAPVGAPATWVLSNHDVTRPVTRYGREDSSFAFARKRFGTPTDIAVGRRRARAAALLAAALPGSLYVYQGDELGLDEVDVPATRSRTRCTLDRAGSTPGATAAGCRCPGAGRRRRSGSARRTRPRRRGSRQPAHWAEPDRRGRGGRCRHRCSASTVRRCGSGDPSPACGDGPFEWLPSEPGRPRLQPRSGLREHHEPVRLADRCCRPTRRCCSPAPTRPTATSRPTPPPGCGQAPSARRGSDGRVPDER